MTTNMQGEALNRDNWPIAAAMINFPGVLADGSLVQEQSVEQWAATLNEVVDAGFTELDPTDSWLRVADLSPERRRDFMALTRSLGLTIPAISTSRRAASSTPSTATRTWSTATGSSTPPPKSVPRRCPSALFGPLTAAQKAELWFLDRRRRAQPPTTRPFAPRP